MEFTIYGTFKDVLFASDEAPSAFDVVIGRDHIGEDPEMGRFLFFKEYNFDLPAGLREGVFSGDDLFAAVSAAATVDNKINHDATDRMYAALGMCI